jgi:branched-chain amino acid transport system permease protein
LFDVRAGTALDILVYWYALFAVVVIVAVSYLFALSRHGLALAAVRDSEIASRSVGVESQRIKWWLWIVVGCATGIVGAIVYIQKGRISPDAAFNVVDWSAYVLFVVVIGGIRTVEGPIVGVMVLWFLQSNLAQYGSLYLLALGLLAIGMMLFAPRGIWGIVAERFDLHLFPIRRTLVRRELVPTSQLKEIATASVPVASKKH